MGELVVDILMDKTLGALYGLAIGDAMGMPGELWSRRRIKQHFGKIDTFISGPQENEAARYYKSGQYTDDTAQSIAILDALIERNFIPSTTAIADHLIEWAEQNQAFEHNILGPSSKIALQTIRTGGNASTVTAKAETNGAAMRIAPIGCLIPSTYMGEIVRYVYEVSRVTHGSDVAISGAAMIAMAVSAAFEDCSWEEIIQKVKDTYSCSLSLYGTETFSPSLKARLDLCLQYAEKFKNEEDAFADHLYHIIGAGTLTCESVPTALALAYYTKDVHKCSIMCANLGGDTDTIGAMATAICGAKVGITGILPEWIETINRSNGVDFTYYAEHLVKYRRFHY